MSETEAVPKSEDECVAAGGKWKDGKCIMPKTAEKFIKAKDEAECKKKGGLWKNGRCMAKPKESTESPEELIAKIASLEEELAEARKDRETLHDMWEEVISNLKEASEEAGEETEEEDFPTFEKWLRDLYEHTKSELEKKKKYPYYPYYPYPRYRCPKAHLEAEEGTEEEEDLPEGEGAISTEDSELREKYDKIAESLRHGDRIREQWTAPTVLASHEIIGHAREFCKVDTLLEDKPGDTVNIATVRDFDLGAWGTYGSPTLADERGSEVIAFDSATVQEAGVKFYMKKHLTEKADSNVVDLVNEVARRAVLRAEDTKVLADIYGTTGILSIDKSAAGVDFDADWVAEIISQFQENGVDVSPGDLVLFIEPAMHEALMKDVAGSMGLVFARPDVIQKGVLTEFMGVTIRVVSHDILPDDGTKAYAIAWKKGAYTFAPKRDFLIETDPEPANRQTLTVVTTAAAGLLANPKYGLKLKTQIAA